MQSHFTLVEYLFTNYLIKNTGEQPYLYSIHKKDTVKYDNNYENN